MVDTFQAMEVQLHNRLKCTDPYMKNHIVAHSFDFSLHFKQNIWHHLDLIQGTAKTMDFVPLEQENIPEEKRMFS